MKLETSVRAAALSLEGIRDQVAQLNANLSALVITSEKRQKELEAVTQTYIKFFAELTARIPIEQTKTTETPP